MCSGNLDDRIQAMFRTAKKKKIARALEIRVKTILEIIMETGCVPYPRAEAKEGLLAPFQKWIPLRTPEVS